MTNPIQQPIAKLTESKLSARVIESLPSEARDALEDLAANDKLTLVRSEPLSEGDTLRGVTVLLGEVPRGAAVRGVNLMKSSVTGGTVRGCNVDVGDLEDGDVRGANGPAGDVRGGVVTKTNLVIGDVHGGSLDANVLLGNVYDGEVSAKVHMVDVVGGSMQSYPRLIEGSGEHP
jgi:hypothetical protein